MNGLQLEIARFLVSKAVTSSRATYQQVGEAIGWGHPTGRGLGAHLEVILHELAQQGLPPLTTILVQKGELAPPRDALVHIRAVLGPTDIADAQRRVWDFDWSSVPALAPSSNASSPLAGLWLTSFWGFAPDQWGCIGFADENKRQRFLRSAGDRTLVAIYVTKGKGPREMRGKVVGILEVSRKIGHAGEFISGDRWVEKEADPESRGKWLHAVEATRAWRIIPEEWRDVEEVFPRAYASANPEFIGSSGVIVGAEEAATLAELSVYEVPVFRQPSPIGVGISTLDAALRPSRAIPPASEPYWVGETDGPKYLYILKLEGDTEAYLGRSASDVDERWIIKVGFSKSPFTRRDQIQSAYPRGAYNWAVFRPNKLGVEPPYANAAVAIAGEDAMKSKLVSDGAEVLGGEFFLAPEWLVHQTWVVGRMQADAAAKAEDARADAAR